jgi:acyl-CoA thioesterase FadM
VDLETNSLLVTGLSKHICVTHEGNVTHLPAEWRQWAID